MVFMYFPHQFYSSFLINATKNYQREARQVTASISEEFLLNVLISGNSSRILKIAVQSLKDGFMLLNIKLRSGV